jgi:hypothetical protein
MAWVTHAAGMASVTDVTEGAEVLIHYHLVVEFTHIVSRQLVNVRAP